MNIFKKIYNIYFKFIFKVPYYAENGDVYNKDNDDDGFKEKEYVKGYTKKDGTKVSDHFRKE